MAGRTTNIGATLEFEQTLWQTADKVRGHMDPSEYKHVALGLIFLKYISDAFEERREEIMREPTDPNSEWHPAGDLATVLLFGIGAACGGFPASSCMQVAAGPQT